MSWRRIEVDHWSIIQSNFYAVVREEAFVFGNILNRKTLKIFRACGKR